MKLILIIPWNKRKVITKDIVIDELQNYMKQDEYTCLYMYAVLFCGFKLFYGNSIFAKVWR